MTEATEKRWIVDADYPAINLQELAENITREYSRQILKDEEFKQFCEKQEEVFTKMREEVEAISCDRYFPGCYGDALADC